MSYNRYISYTFKIYIIFLKGKIEKGIITTERNIRGKENI